MPTSPASRIQHGRIGAVPLGTAAGRRLLACQNLTEIPGRDGSGPSWESGDPRNDETALRDLVSGDEARGALGAREVKRALTDTRARFNDE
jgi:hypothetical protein